MPPKTVTPEVPEPMDVWQLETNMCFEKTVTEAVGEPGDKGYRPARKEFWRILRFDKPEVIVRNNAGGDKGLIPYRVVQGEIVPTNAVRVMIEPSGDINLELQHKNPALRTQISMKVEKLWAWAAKNGLTLSVDADGEPYQFKYNNYHETVEGRMERAKRIKPIWETW